MRFLSRAPNIDFMAVRKPMLGLSVLLLLASAVILGVRGLNFGIDFCCFLEALGASLLVFYALKTRFKIEGFLVM